ncbi:TonB-dependent receptor [Maricaulis sp. CAU 1757]
MPARALASLLALAGPVAPAMAAQAVDDVIVVTGDRQGESRDAAIQPISVIDGATIDRVGAQHPSELLNGEAGVFINRGNGAEHLTSIRSPVLTGGDGAGSFLYLEDGVPLRAAGFANVNGLFEDVGDLAGGVEVLRGPGPALYGSNALHGLVNTLTPDPQTAPEMVEVALGSLGRTSGRARLVRRGEATSALLAASFRHEAGWRDEAGLEHGRVLVRADGQAGETRWRLTGAFVQLHQETAGYVGGDDAYRDREASKRNADPEAFRDAVALRLALRLDRPLSEHWSVTATPYVRANEMDFLMHFLPSEALEESGHASVGVQSALVREDGRTRLALGLDVEESRGELRETQSRPTIFSFVQGEHYDYTVEAQSLALYAQGRWQVTPALAVQAGVRGERTEYDYDNHLPDNTVGRFLRRADRSDDFETLTPHAGFTLAVSDRSRVFGRVARGSRAPQTAELYRLQPGQETARIEPVVLDSAELGWRWAQAGTGRLEIVAFAMEKRNVFFRDADGFNVTDGATDHVGIEVDAEWVVTPKLVVEATGSWARHTYAFDRPVGRAGESIRSGDDVDTAPRWLWQAGLVWSPMPDTTLDVSWQHVGAYAMDAANSREYDGHDLVSVGASWDMRPGATLFGRVRNLADVRYAERADFAFGNARYFPGEPRGLTVGVRLVR